MAMAEQTGEVEGIQYTLDVIVNCLLSSVLRFEAFLSPRLSRSCIRPRERKRVEKSFQINFT